mmetsp:Transcript_26578/g.64166  ORF Transcript_26578/g.64166 Transcript_26578/m.64166 type:complete len:86 (+) Transcript_26578:992-1249(+)
MRSGPIIEHSTCLRFAPYHLTYGDLPKQLQQGGLSEETDMWSKVEDFNWLRAQQSPNWSVLPQEERAPPISPHGVPGAAEDENEI